MEDSIMIIIISAVIILFNAPIAIIYSIAMSNYYISNRKQSEDDELKSNEISLINEVKEFMESKDFFDTVIEAYDIWQMVLKIMAIKLFGGWILEHKFVWLSIFTFCPLSGYKVSFRYLRYGCIRSKKHHSIRGESDHVCDLKFH